MKFTDKNEPDYKFNCLIDFLYFIKSYFNDNIYYTELNKDIAFNEKFYFLFNEGVSTKEKSSSEEEKKEINEKAYKHISKKEIFAQQANQDIPFKEKEGADLNNK